MQATDLERLELGHVRQLWRDRIAILRVLVVGYDSGQGNGGVGVATLLISLGY